MGRGKSVAPIPGEQTAREGQGSSVAAPQNETSEGREVDRGLSVGEGVMHGSSPKDYLGSVSAAHGTSKPEFISGGKGMRMLNQASKHCFAPLLGSGAE